MWYVVIGCSGRFQGFVCAALNGVFEVDFSASKVEVVVIGIFFLLHHICGLERRVGRIVAVKGLPTYRKLSYTRCPHRVKIMARR